MIARRPRRPAPTWFVLALTLGALLILRDIEPRHHGSAPVDQAFWFFIAWIAEAIWNGLEAAGHITLVIVAASLQAAWAFARSVWNLAIDLGSEVAKGLKASWGFLQKLYDDILKPAWLRFWALVDRVRGALERALRPVLRFLATVRRELLELYAKWIRPVLDTIDATRKILKVLETLHIEWAAKLDAALARVEDQIDASFRWVLAKVNEVINLVNRVVTADGLFQRLALVRSIQRDILYVDRVWRNTRLNPWSDADRDELAGHNPPQPLATTRLDFARALKSHTGPIAELVDECDFTGTIFDRARAA